jgi:dipeptidyl-peptidase-4
MRYLDSGEEKQLTTDGIENYGYATDNAGWRQSERPIVLWSPDSKKIATFQQDQRHVSDMHLVTTNVGAPTLKSWKYPLPEDEKIIQIERVIIEVDNGKMVRLDMPSDDRRGTLCDDISCTGLLMTISGSTMANNWSLFPPPEIIKLLNSELPMPVRVKSEIS